ncbi:MAG: UvrD-helicase domain-containing protein, partial [Flavobacteriales bacterium]
MSENPEGLFQLYRASAGSGKTYSLVKMFLLCCLAHPKPTYFRHILAITFTNKAAGEMKARVLRALDEMSKGMQETLFEELHRESKLDREKLREQIKAIHKMMLHRYGELSIMTIDKFVNRLVRSFTKDLGLNADYRIELNQGAIVEAAVDRLLSEVGQDQELTKVLEEYVLDLVEDEKSWKIRDALSEFGKNLFREKVQPVLDEVKSKSPLELLAAQNKIKRELFSAKSLWVKTASDSLDLIQRRGLEDAFSRGSVPNYLRAIKARNFKPFSATLQKDFLAGEFSSPKRVSDGDKAVLEEITPELLKGLEVLYNAFQPEQLGRYLLLEKLNKKVFQMAVLGKLEQFSKDHQEVENV